MSSVASDTACLFQRVDLAIRENPYLAGRRLQVETHEGHVTLKGCVGTFFQKQMAQETLRRVDGVQQIDNRLEVDWR